MAEGSVEEFGGTIATGSIEAPRTRSASGELAIAGIASAAAGAIHVAAWGAHGDATTLAVLFVVLAIAQIEVAVAGLVRPNNLTASALAIVNLAAVAGWVTTRFVGISWIDGLQQAEDPGLADTIAAVLAGVAVVAATSFFGTRDESRPARALPITAIAAVAAALTIPAVVDATSHEHSHSEGTADHGPRPHRGCDGDRNTWPHRGCDGDRNRWPHRRRDAAHATDDATPAATGDTHGHTDDAATTSAMTWPRPWDPTAPIDFSGVEGVTAEQQARAEQLARDTLAELPQFADVSTLGAARLSVDRRLQHRLRALHQPWPHLRRRVARPEQARVARLPRRRQPTHARVGDVHRQRKAARRPRARRLRRTVDAVARPRQPLLGARRQWQPGGQGDHRRRRQLSDGHREGRRREPDGARLDRAARVRSVRGPRRARCRTGGRRRAARRPMRARPRSDRRPRARRWPPHRTTRTCRSTSAVSRA